MGMTNLWRRVLTCNGHKLIVGLILVIPTVVYFFPTSYQFQNNSFRYTKNEISYLKRYLNVTIGQEPFETNFEAKLMYELKFRNVSDIEKRLFERLQSIKKSCGQVCDTTIRGKQGEFYENIIKKIDCNSLFSNEDIDFPTEFVSPPYRIPTSLLPEFTHGGRLRVVSEYRDNSKGQRHDIHWTKKTIQLQSFQFKTGTLLGAYGQEVVNTISEFIDKLVNVTGKKVLVIGSQSPWLESILLVKGARKITTFDYVSIRSDHPKVETITPDGLSRKFFDGKRYDVMLSYSSLEHSGLGRYGDQLNPWGDLIAMARSWCLVKPGGKALVGVPSGEDILGFNSHRVYGPNMYSQLFANWEVLNTDTDFKMFSGEKIADYQSLHVLARLDV